MRWLTRFFRSEAPDPGPPSLRAVRFDTRHWVPRRRAVKSLEWTNPDGDTLSAWMDSDLTKDRIPLTNLDALRAFYRQQSANQGGGIVSVDAVRTPQLSVLRVIDKYERLPAYAYDGRLIIPLKEVSCILMVRSIERGVTGTRDAAVTAHLAQRGELEIEECEDQSGGQGRIKGWFQDPYDAAYQGPMLYSMSDDERLDALFPHHPLTKIRAWLTRMQSTLVIDESLLPNDIDVPSTHRPEPMQQARYLLSSDSVGSLYLMAGRFDVAERLLEEGTVSPSEGVASAVDTARHLLLLGLAQDGNGNHVGAVQSLSQACDMFKESVGADNTETAQAHCNLARVYVHLGEYKDAEPLFEAALRVFEDKPMPGSNAAVALNGLGLVRKAQGRYAEAIPYFERALDIFEKVHGPQFPDCATVLRNMAHAFRQIGDSRRTERTAALWSAEGVWGRVSG